MYPINHLNDENLQEKILWGPGDERLNLDQLESTNLDQSLISKIKEQAKSIACLISKEYMIPKKMEKQEGWGFCSYSPTLSERVRRREEFKNVQFGEQEAFKDEIAPGFGSAFLVGKRLALTAAHCVTMEKSNVLDHGTIENTRLVFGFHEVKKKPSDYFFFKYQVRQIKRVICHSYTKQSTNCSRFFRYEWTDWALLELDEDVPFIPLQMKWHEKIANNIELYMLGHPTGLPLKFTWHAKADKNEHQDYFECRLDAFGGNSGSFVGAMSNQEGIGILFEGPPKDYEITDNYKGTGKKRIQARHITKLEQWITTYERCQRINTLVSHMSQFLGPMGIKPRQNVSSLITQSLKESYKSQNMILRTVSEPLPIEGIYTELILKEENNNAENCKNITEHNKIELSQLFDAKGKIRKRFSIIGGAGSGKTVLCQNMAYLWAQDKIWEGKFDAVFLLPLRHLQHSPATETISSFIYRFCCQENSITFYSENIADYLKQNRNRILFILDGLDEVTLGKNTVQQQILDELLSFPHWILTSRPHTIESIQADATIENIGFNSKTIDLYIQRTSQKQNSQQIIEKIGKNPLIYSLCHIPINLELICDTLQKHQNISTTSTTFLYEKLVLTLQQRFINNQFLSGKLSKEVLKEIKKDSVWHLSFEDMEKITEVSSIFKWLESVAWIGMKEKKASFFFNQGKMVKIYQNCPLIEYAKREQLFKDMCSSGFLKATGSSTSFLGREYSFHHSTIQEFFAARYLICLLKENPKKAESCIQKIKFNPRYHALMCFIAGILGNEKKALIRAFFEILDRTSDLIGLYGAILKIGCLEECDWKVTPEKIEIYKNQIMYWIDKMDLGVPMDTPINKQMFEAIRMSPKGAKLLFIPKLVSYLSNDHNFFAINALGEIGIADPEIAIEALLKIYNSNKEKRIVINALGKLGHTNPKKVIPILIENLENEDSILQKDVKRYLNTLAQMDPKAVIPALVETLKNKKSRARHDALSILGEIGQSDSKSVIPALLGSLNDSEINIDAVKTLGLIGKSDAAVIIGELTKILNDKDSPVCYSAAEAISLLGDTKTALLKLLEILKAEAKPLDEIRVKCNGIEVPIEVTRKFFTPQFYEEFNSPGLATARIIAEVIGRIGQIDRNSCMDILLQEFKNKMPEVRACIAIAFGKIGYAIPVNAVLHEAFKKDNDLVRACVANSLVQIGNADFQLVIPALVEGTKHQFIWVREHSVENLGLIGQANPRIVIPTLIEALNDENVAVRAMEAIIQIGRVDPIAAIPGLLVGIKHKFLGIRQTAIEALGHLGQVIPEAVISLLFTIVKNEHDIMLRIKAAKTLSIIGQMNGQTIVPELIEILKSTKDSSLRLAIEYTLGRLGQVYSQSTLLELLENDKKLSETLLNKFDISSYLKTNPEILKKLNCNILSSTPLSSLIASYKENKSYSSIYSAAIAKKCIEENLPFFQEENAICFYEENNLCRVLNSEISNLLPEIEERVNEYPHFAFDQSSIFDHPWECTVQ